MNEVLYREAGAPDLAHGLSAASMGQPVVGAAQEDLAQRLVTQMRREMEELIDWRVQQQIATRKGPSLSEIGVMLGSLAIGAIVTGILVSNTTTVFLGFAGMHHVEHTDTLPYIIVVWAALLCINAVWALRRR